MAVNEEGRYLVSFESGHYKSLSGKWLGDSVWCHIAKNDGSIVHINKDKVEYIQVWGNQDATNKEG